MVGCRFPLNDGEVDLPLLFPPLNVGCRTWSGGWLLVGLLMLARPRMGLGEPSEPLKYG